MFETNLDKVTFAAVLGLAIGVVLTTISTPILAAALIHLELTDS